MRSPTLLSDSSSFGLQMSPPMHRRDKVASSKYFQASYSTPPALADTPTNPPKRGASFSSQMSPKSLNNSSFSSINSDQMRPSTPQPLFRSSSEYKSMTPSQKHYIEREKKQHGNSRNRRDMLSLSPEKLYREGAQRSMKQRSNSSMDPPHLFAPTTSLSQALESSPYAQQTQREQHEKAVKNAIRSRYRQSPLAAALGAAATSGLMATAYMNPLQEPDIAAITVTTPSEHDDSDNDSDLEFFLTENRPSSSPIKAQQQGRLTRSSSTNNTPIQARRHWETAIRGAVAQSADYGRGAFRRHASNSSNNESNTSNSNANESESNISEVSSPSKKQSITPTPGRTNRSIMSPKCTGNGGFVTVDGRPCSSMSLDSYRDEFSSTLTQLVLTKDTVQEEALRDAEYNVIFEVPGSVDLKRTIAKMFANPKTSHEISMQEYARREKKLIEEKERSVKRQQEIVRKESERLMQEIRQFHEQAYE